MAVETGREPEREGQDDATAAEARDRNGVAVCFSDGTERGYAVVIRPHEDDWLHAERLVGDGDGLDEEEIEAINPDAVRRLRADRVHFFDGGALYYGDGLLVDPDALVAEWGLD